MAEMEFHICCTCGIEYGAPKDFFDTRRNNERREYEAWHCPNGHSQVFRQNEAQKQRRRAELAEQRLAQRDDEIRDLGRAVSAQKGNVTKLKRRAAAGVCPCCQRSFSNVKAHIANKHPEFVADQRLDVAKIALVK